MKSIVPAVLLAIGIVGISGCAAQSESATAAGPKFTEEEKAAMTEEEKLAIYNEQVREEERVTCRPERTTGSHMQRRTCRTAQEKRLEREAAEEAMRNSRNAPAPTGN